MTAKPVSRIKRLCVDALTMFFVSGLSLLLLMYVGFGEAQRTFQQLHVEKLIAQARVVQSALESYLRPGLPLKQYVGFTTSADPITQSDPSIAALSVFDESGAIAFVSGDSSILLLDKSTTVGGDPGGSYDVRESEDFVQVVFSLRNRFEAVGSLAITMPRSVVTKHVEDSFRPLLYVALGLSLVFSLVVAVAGPRFAARKTPWLQIIYAAVFLTMAAVVIGTLISLYSVGVQAKTKALADSLGQRLSDIVAFNLNLSGIHGLDRTFGDYLKLNPDISAAGLTIDHEIKIHTDERLIGKKWVSEQDNYEYIVDLTPPGSARKIRVFVALPSAVVYRQIARSVKNFTALFVASAFLAGVFLQLAAAKTKALADSLGQRLSDIVAFNLNLSGIHGLDRTFGDYLKLNPDISAAGLTIDHEIKIHTDERLIGKKWVSEQDNYEYIVDLTPPGSARKIRVFVALPSAVVYRQIARSVKNFTALFVASAFLAGVFLQLAASMQRFHLMQGKEGEGGVRLQGEEAALNLVKPVFFVAVLVEHLTYAFLPQFMHEVVGNAGLSPGYASAPFMAYYLFFALALVPAGHFAQQHSPKPLMYWGLLLASAGLLILTLPLDFNLAMLARSLSGTGQGMLFIGVQSYILAVASPSKRTQGAAIIVFGFQGGMISGMAIGSLLVIYIGASGVFTLGASIGLGLVLYAVAILPAARREDASDTSFTQTVGQLLRNTGQALRSLRFMKTMLLIGIPAKAVLTGVIIFALPLILSERNYAQEDIGQIIMVYAAGVVVASSYISRLVDRIGQSHVVLFWGTAISGLGLILIGSLGSDFIGRLPSGSMTEPVILIVGVVVVGIAHGFINAPVVTHIAESPLSQAIGESSSTATYRFLERIGHIAGPIIVGQLFLFAGQDAFVLTWIGGVVILFGLLFLIGTGRSQSQIANTPEHRINRVSQEIM